MLNNDLLQFQIYFGIFLLKNILILSVYECENRHLMNTVYKWREVTISVQFNLVLKAIKNLNFN